MDLFPKPLVAASLEPIMLTLLQQRAMYGYELIQRVEELSGGRLQWKANKLYPLLHQLENEKIVEAYWHRSESGPDRKYYRLTDQGRKALDQSRAHWRELGVLLSKLWEMDDVLIPQSP